MAEKEPGGYQPESFTQWQYKRLPVFTTQDFLPQSYKTAQGKDVGWRLNLPSQWKDKKVFVGTDPYCARFLRDKLLLADRQLSLALNPERDWNEILRGDRYEWLSWDDESQFADLVDSVMEKLGRQAWELVGTQQVPSMGLVGQSQLCYYLFKKPGIRVIEPPLASS